MANGRFITNAMPADKKVNELSDDTSRMALTWLITFADIEGRTYGDPSVVRSMLFPRRQDISVEKMEEYIREWATFGMIIWYESDGDKWICFTHFDKHQKGLRRDHEAPSKVPTPPHLYEEATPTLRQPSADQTPDKGQPSDDPTPTKRPLKLSQVKLSQVKASSPENKTTTPPFSEFMTAFCDRTHLPENRINPQKACDAIDQMVDAGCVVEDMVGAIDELLEKGGYNIVGPWSVVNATCIQMSRREKKPAAKKKDDLSGYTICGEPMAKVVKS